LERETRPAAAELEDAWPVAGDPACTKKFDDPIMTCLIESRPMPSRTRPFRRPATW
jgi:hypothetical protein